MIWRHRRNTRFAAFTFPTFFHPFTHTQKFQFYLKSLDRLPMRTVFSQPMGMKVLNQADRKMNALWCARSRCEMTTCPTSIGWVLSLLSKKLEITSWEILIHLSSLLSIMGRYNFRFVTSHQLGRCVALELFKSPTSWLKQIHTYSVYYINPTILQYWWCLQSSFLCHWGPLWMMCVSCICTWILLLSG